MAPLLDRHIENALTGSLRAVSQDPFVTSKLGAREGNEETAVEVLLHLGKTKGIMRLRQRKGCVIRKSVGKLDIRNSVMIRMTLQKKRPKSGR